MKFPLPTFLLAAIAAFATPAFADSQPATDPVAIRGDFSGTWYDPAQSGHGLTLEILDGNRVAAAWFTFAPDGSQLWLSGVGTVDGASLHVPVSRTTGGAFPPAFDPDAIEHVAWGNLDFTFTGCDVGTLTWAPIGAPPGSMPLQRLTAVQGTRCNVEEEWDEQRIYSFERSTNHFFPIFADYPRGQEQFYELDYVYEALPAPLAGRRGVRLSGNNHSDDLAMLITREMGGLAPNSAYRLELEVELASNTPSGCFGTGGSPGESVWIKLGASTIEPFAPTVVEGGVEMKRFNIDFGRQSSSGEDAIVVGTLGNGQSCEDAGTWTLRTLSTQGQPFTATTDANGALWLIAGSDSGFESRTDWYITALRVRYRPAVEPAGG